MRRSVRVLLVSGSLIGGLCAWRAVVAPKPFRVGPCPAADSLIGTDRLRLQGLAAAAVEEKTGDSIFITGHRLLNSGDFHLWGSVLRETVPAAPIRMAQLTLVVVNATPHAPVSRAALDSVWADADGDVHLHFGPPQVRQQLKDSTGYGSSAEIVISPAAMLSIVRAHAIAFTWKGRRLTPSEDELADLQAVFRASYCPDARLAH